MKYIKCFEKFNFDELAILSDLEKAILHLVRIHEKTYYNDTKISDEFMFKRDIKELIQMGIERKKFELNPRKYPHNPNISKGISADHILATISDYQIGIYEEDRLGIDDQNVDTSLRLELDILLDPLKKREDDIITSRYYLDDMRKTIKSAMDFDKDGVYQRTYRD